MNEPLRRDGTFRWLRAGPSSQWVSSRRSTLARRARTRRVCSAGREGDSDCQRPVRSSSRQTCVTSRAAARPRERHQARPRPPGRRRRRDCAAIPSRPHSTQCSSMRRARDLAHCGVVQMLAGVSKPSDITELAVLAACACLLRQRRWSARWSTHLQRVHALTAEESIDHPTPAGIRSRSQLNPQSARGGVFGTGGGCCRTMQTRTEWC